VRDRSPSRRPRRKGRAASDGERRQLAWASRHAATGQPPAPPAPGDWARLLCDGGSRGNPGPAAAAAVLLAADGTVRDSRCEPIGRATAGEAEYHAILLGLRLAAAHGADPVEIRSDSQLAIAALEDDGAATPLVADIRAAAAAFSAVRWRWHPRGDNAAADALVRGLLWR
jgi:ribonuclease HI